MPILLDKQTVKQRQMIRDVRPASQRISEYWRRPNSAAMVAFGIVGIMAMNFPMFAGYFDVFALLTYWYYRWFFKQKFKLTFKIPRYANIADPNNPAPGKSGGGRSDGILFLGNVSDIDHDDYGKELWLTNNDARTHILYLGTTGSGKTEGLKSMVANALAWGSGYAYTDGKADTDLWASLYASARRFGRDDDVLILNYMTGNSDDGAVSNTMNPFSNGSASYLANMVVSFMPDAGGDNAMWKERAVALMFALMPALTYKRDKQGLLLDIGVVRDHIELQPIIRLSRDQTLPERILHGLNGYLHTLPGFVDAAFDDEGNERPPSPDQPMYDLQVARQQHGYLSMQFTRALQSLADEYGYIFKAQLADIDVLDVVLNRRILIVLIPALEKSGDEAANLGKIVVASLKGMMGMTLGNTVEGSWETAIGSKQTRSSSSFMTVFDEVGYYTAPGMAVMAAQARSLGFSLVFAAQDLPSMEKRVKQEAKSIVGNCNLKILGRIEDPTDTKEFVTRHGGQNWVVETKGFTSHTNTVSNFFMGTPFYDDRGAGGPVVRQRVDYDHLRGQREGEAHLIIGDWACKAQMFYAKPDKVDALRVHRLLPVPSSTPSTTARERAMNEMTSRLQDSSWTAATANAAVATSADIAALADSLKQAMSAGKPGEEAAITALRSLGNAPAQSTTTSGSTKAPPAEPRTQATAPSQPTGKPNNATAPATVAEKAPLVPVTLTKTEKAALPPLFEGDQFAIGDLEQAPAAQAVSPPPAQTTSKAAVPAATQSPTVTATPTEGKPAGSKSPAGFSASDADMALMKMQQNAGSNDDITQVKLSPEITDTLAKSAQAINEGLTGNKG